jgi:anaerobic selenocysteine-containing dehydrogenase
MIDGSILLEGGKDYSPVTGKERKAIPSACWQCVARDGMIGYVEDGRVTHLEGNPKLPRTNGKLCARGQGGVGQLYDPDRLMFPMKRIGKRGEGKWKRISWDDALTELGGRMKKLKDAGTPEKVMFHYGRMKASSSKMIKSYFLPAYGTGTIGNHTSICEGGKWTAQELIWGKHYDVWDVNNTNYILNFGCNFFEAHTNHIALSQRAIKAKVERGVKIVTFDVRLSNTAAMSDEWVPIRPGTDGAVALAMCHVILAEGPVDQKFLETWTNVTVDQLKTHLQSNTPEWAEKISGVPASTIRRIALEFANAKPGTAASYRGAVAHYNGVDNERAIKMLDAICGYIDVKGGTCHAVGAKWKNSYPTPKGKTSKLKIGDGGVSKQETYAYPSHHANHQVLKMIKDGSHGRPDIYIAYCYNPAYVNGECGENVEILKDESLIPYLVAVDVSYSEIAALADLILPDATYLERWDWEDMVSMNMIPEYYIRQPLVKPLGEAKDFKDVCCDLALRLGGSVAEAVPFRSAEEFVRDACEHTPGVKEAGGFQYMVANGAWVDPKAKPKYAAQAKKLSKEEIEAKLADGSYKKNSFGTVYKPDKCKDKENYGADGGSWKDYKAYVCQEIGGEYYAGFKPDKVAKSGLMEISSPFLEKKGFPALPTYMPIPEHQSIGPGELILTTYKVNVQTHSRTQNCKYLTELYHENPGWINPETAKKLGVSDGDNVKLTAAVIGKSLTTPVRVTDGIVPGVIAISNHCGHWEYGRYATAGKHPNPLADGDLEAADTDMKLMWWKNNGNHPNFIIPNSGDPIAGQMRWMDTVVSVEKA